MNDMIGSTDYKKKGFFSRPEGATGMILMAAAGVALFMFWGTIVPFLFATAATTIGLMVELAVIALIVYCVTNPQIRTAFFYLFRTICRWFTGWVIELDPIAILKTHIVELKKQKAMADEEIAKVAGAEEDLNSRIKQNTVDMAKTKKEYDVCVNRGMAAEDIQHLVIRMGGLDNMNKNLLPLQGNLARIHEHLNRISKASNSYILQISETVTLKEIEFKAIRAASKAMKSAMSIFKGDPDKMAMFEDAMEFITADVAAKVGEIKMAIESSSEYLTKIDIQNAVMVDDGTDLMSNFDPSNYSILTVDQISNDRNQKKAIGMTPAQINNMDNGNVPVMVPVQSKYSRP